MVKKEMKLKKIFVIAFCFAAVCVIASCGKKKEEPKEKITVSGEFYNFPEGTVKYVNTKDATVALTAFPESEDVIGTLNNGEKVFALKKTTSLTTFNGKTDYWFYVKKDDYRTEGWIFGSNLIDYLPEKEDYIEGDITIEYLYGTWIGDTAYVTFDNEGKVTSGPLNDIEAPERYSFSLYGNNSEKICLGQYNPELNCEEQVDVWTIVALTQKKLVLFKNGRRYVYDCEAAGEDDYSSVSIEASDLLMEWNCGNTFVIFDGSGSLSMKIYEDDGVSSYSGTWTIDSENMISVYISSSDYEDEVQHRFWQAERDAEGRIRIFTGGEDYLTVSK